MFFKKYIDKIKQQSDYISELIKQNQRQTVRVVMYKSQAEEIREKLVEMTRLKERFKTKSDKSRKELFDINNSKQGFDE